MSEHNLEKSIEGMYVFAEKVLDIIEGLRVKIAQLETRISELEGEPK